MRQYTTKSDRCADEGVQFFVSSDGELQMARRDTLDFQIFRGVAGQFEDFCGEVFEDSGNIDGG